jgi:2-dehydro-3-deoxyphosphogluconate aldolase/(4S)-4-hydroxy-2-oxoglutarate aldolase
VVEAARAACVAFVPGVATPSEIEHARALGYRILKIFPASLVGGPAFVKAVAPVYPDVRFAPRGGVNPENLASYLTLPSVLACGGTWTCERTLLEGRRSAEVERVVRGGAARVAR